VYESCKAWHSGESTGACPTGVAVGVSGVVLATGVMPGVGVDVTVVGVRVGVRVGVHVGVHAAARVAVGSTGVELGDEPPPGEVGGAVAGTGVWVRLLKRAGS
jgi:hypothetical protein